MRIGIFTETYIPNTDGVVTSILSFQHELEKRGHDVYVFAPGKENADGLTTFWYKSTGMKEYPEFPIAVYPSIGRSRSLKLVKEKGIEIIHIQSPGLIGYRGVRTAKKLRLPAVITYHTSLTELAGYLPPVKKFPKLDGPMRPLIWRASAWFFYQCEAVIAPSEAIKNEILENCGKWVKKIFVVPTGVNIQRFSGATGKEVREKHGLGKKKVILHVGRVVREKRIETIISAAPYVLKYAPDAMFLIVGKGPAMAEYKRLVEQKGLSESFIFTGYVPDEDLPKYYAAADAFAIASDIETQGLVVLEAMAAGRPVAAANARALPEFVKEGENGALFKPRNPRSCAGAIVRVLKNSKQLRKNAKKTALNYSREKCADRLMAVYKWAIAHKAAKRKKVRSKPNAVIGAISAILHR
ncbi:MAG: glycosyltransferase [Candidatus Thermoplasmatota archaeon]|nr:glycosyltransferase [Candidatus Thermoplasmatota archaeon]